MNENTKGSVLESCDDLTARDKRNQLRILPVLLVWAALFVTAGQVIKRELLADGPMLWLVGILPVVAGVFVILGYARFLREADELQRVIHYQALALGFGAAWLAISAASILEKAGAVFDGVEIITWAMVGVYSIWIVVGQRRYR